jgi:hypothetical protein
MVPGYKVALGPSLPGRQTLARFLSSKEAIIVAALIVAAVVAIVLWRR